MNDNKKENENEVNKEENLKEVNEGSKENEG